ncbi:MAG: SoxR reducing system RseC family protein [Desulfobacterales bacterium]|nr:SoxR reducing system RseC family protein [Desulfobacterales bacterium]
MTERIGLVVSVFDNQTAEVMTDKKSACGGCADTRSCKSCLSGGDKVIAVVRNELQADAGDIVVVEHTKGALWGSAALFYLLPVFGLMAGAFAGLAAAGGWGINESDGAVLFGLTGLAAGLLAVFYVSRSAYAKDRLVPRIIRIAEHGVGRTQAVVQRAPAAPTRSCCG